MASILIIDDDEQVCSLLNEALETAGYETVTARNGVEGIKRYHESPCDLVILDILMPEKEGLETILELRREYPAIKIIAISGGSERAHLNLLDLAQRLGAYRTLKKPFRIDEVLDVVSSAMAS